MFRQYCEVKAKLAPGTLLLFRLGDFFEMFDEDARIGANILGLTLTARHGRPMAGLPFHAVDGYIRRLLEAGKKVALCDQQEEARPGKLVKRELTRVYTPGTALSAEHLRAEHNHYLLSLSCEGKKLSASWMELSTGEWSAATSEDSAGLLNFLIILQPAELIVPEGGLPAGIKETLIENLPGLSVSELPASFFENAGAVRILREALGVATLKGFGFADDHPAISAAGALYSYAKQALCSAPANLKELKLCVFENRLMIDPNTARQLEIFRALDGGREGSLLRALDSTMTSAGARLLEKALLSPCVELDRIRERHAAVGALASSPQALQELRGLLSTLRDLERILSRLQNKLRAPRELSATRDTLRALPRLKAALSRFRAGALEWIMGGISTHEDLEKRLSAALEDEPNNDLTEGGYIRDGYDAELDRLKSLSANHKIWIAELERLEQERTGIKSLKVKYNQNFGFFIEVTKSNLARVPADYIRKSTTVGGERYITAALQERQKEILSAESNAIRREMEIFEGLVSEVVSEADALRRTAQALAWCDLMGAFAFNALKWGYCRPEMADDEALELIGGRHPVVEQALVAGGDSEKFVPNDARMSASAEQILLITGPNMAGKSTYIRQVALIVLMAQLGSFVPATRARIGIADRIFSRIGSSDALSRGESTFMVEMTETSYILRTATQKSLIVLDEIGRGTSTYDGLSIAWACVEYLHASPSAGPRTLFATHYHEMTRLEKTLPRLKNYTVSVKESAGKIIFVRKVVPGTADRSYGIHVAQIAGLPKAVVDRATKLLEGLEAQAKAPKQKTQKAAEGQLGLFG
jgi:DNA mismatch repair protein MutS